MAGFLTGSKVENIVSWREDLKSRNKAFKSLDEYQKKLRGIQSQMSSLGNIKIKVQGLEQLKKIQKLSSSGSGTTVNKNRGTVKSGLMGPTKGMYEKSQKEELGNWLRRAAEQEKAANASAAAEKAIARKADLVSIKSAKQEEKKLNLWLSNALKADNAKLSADRKAELASIKAAKQEERSINSRIANTLKADNAKIAAERKTANAAAISAARELVKQNQRLSMIQKFALTKNMYDMNALERESIILGLTKIRNTQKLGVAIAQQKAQLASQVSTRKAILREQNKLNFAQERGLGSLKQMAGAYFSVFTLMHGIGAVAKTGMDFEKMNLAMASVSGSTKEAKENIAFVRAETLRLGGDVMQNTKAFTKLLANKGEMSLDDVKLIYTGVAELSAARGLSADEVNRSINALNQMAGKTKVQAEELRQQLAEALPGSVQMFAKAAKDAGLTVNGTVSELEDLMRNGKALAKDILPKAALQMKKAANTNDALTNSLEILTKVVDRARSGLYYFQDDLYESGFRSGLKYLLQGFNNLMKSSKLLGKLLGGFFRGAVTSLVAPFRLVYALMLDITNLLPTKWKNASMVAAEGFGVLAGSVLAVVGGLWALKKAWGAVKNIKNIGKMFKTATDVVKGGGLADVASGGMGTRVFVTNMPKGGFGGGTTPIGKVGKGFLSRTLAFLPYILLIYEHFKTQSENDKRINKAMGLPEDFGSFSAIFKEGGQPFPSLAQSQKSMFNPYQNQLQGKGSYSYTTQGPQKVIVDIVTDSDHIKGVVRKEVNSTYQSVYN